MNGHIEKPGTGVLFWEPEDKRKSPNGPDYKGFVTLKMDYKAGDKIKLAGWVKKTRMGFNLISVLEDTYTREKQEAGRVHDDVEVEYRSPRRDAPRNSKPKNWDDGDVPF